MRRIMAVLALLVMAGCGGGDSSGEDATATSVGAAATDPATAEVAANDTTSDTTATTGGGQSIDVAAARYLELTVESNCIAARAGDLGLAELGPNDWPEIQATVQPLFRELAESEVRLYEGLVGEVWPTEAQPAVDDLVKALTTEAGQWMTVAEASSYDQLAAAIGRIEGNSTAAAAQVRVRLGLESNITDSTDYCDPAA